MRRRGKRLWLPPAVSLGLHGIVLAAAMTLMHGSGSDEAARGDEDAITLEMSRKVKVHAAKPPAPPKPLPATFAPAPIAPPMKRPEFEPLKPMLPDPPKNLITAATSTASVLLPREKEASDHPPKAEPRKTKAVQDSPPKPAADTAKAIGKKSDAPPSAGSPGYLSLRTVNHIRRGKASYPAEALRKKQTGTVRLLLYINERGTVDRVEIAQSSGFPSLDAAAMAAERRSIFKPAIINGSPVKSKVIVPYTFQLK